MPCAASAGATVGEGSRIGTGGDGRRGAALTPLADLLSGGDRRSIGRAVQAARELLRGERTPDAFLALIEAGAPVARMRAADALEKASRHAPRLLAGAQGRLLDLLASAQPREARWHLLQMCPRLAWPPGTHARLLAAVEAGLADTSAIVRVSALQALADLAHLGESFGRAYERHLPAALASPMPSVRARARRLAEGAGA